MSTSLLKMHRLAKYLLIEKRLDAGRRRSVQAISTAVDSVILS